MNGLGIRLMNTHTFTINTKTAEQPLIVTEIALEDFRAQGLSAMDECLERIGSQSNPHQIPVGRDLPARETLVGQLMLDGFATGNTRKMILCALWMAHNHPDVTGLVSTGPEFEFIYADATDRPPHGWAGRAS